MTAGKEDEAIGGEGLGRKSDGVKVGTMGSSMRVLECMVSSSYSI